MANKSNESIVELDILLIIAAVSGQRDSMYIFTFGKSYALPINVSVMKIMVKLIIRILYQFYDSIMSSDYKYKFLFVRFSEITLCMENILFMETHQILTYS